MSSSLSRFSGWRSRSLALGEGLTRPTRRLRSTPSASRRRTFSSVNLLANNCYGSLIDRSCIPRLDGCEIGFARLVSRARASHGP